MPSAVQSSPLDRDTLARTVYGEARSEPWAGQVAVAWVVRNRAESTTTWWGRGIRGCCVAPYQFEAWAKDNPNRSLMNGATEEMPAFRVARAAAEAVLEGAIQDLSLGADHYYSTSMPSPPSWASAYVATQAIGRHKFFRSLPGSMPRV